MSGIVEDFDCFASLPSRGTIAIAEPAPDSPNGMFATDFSAAMPLKSWFKFGVLSSRQFQPNHSLFNF